MCIRDSRGRPRQAAELHPKPAHLPSWRHRRARRHEALPVAVQLDAAHTARARESARPRPPRRAKPEAHRALAPPLGILRPVGAVSMHRDRRHALGQPRRLEPRGGEVGAARRHAVPVEVGDAEVVRSKRVAAERGLLEERDRRRARVGAPGRPSYQPVERHLREAVVGVRLGRRVGGTAEPRGGLGRVVLQGRRQCLEVCATQLEHGGAEPALSREPVPLEHLVGALPLAEPRHAAHLGREQQLADGPAALRPRAAVKPSVRVVVAHGRVAVPYDPRPTLAALDRHAMVQIALVDGRIAPHQRQHAPATACQRDVQAAAILAAIVGEADDDAHQRVAVVMRRMRHALVWPVAPDQRVARRAAPAGHIAAARVRVALPDVRRDALAQDRLHERLQLPPQWCP
eukprot:4962919-Prymnesium_polylepis.2